jgi:hypothetical protein
MPPVAFTIWEEEDDDQDEGIPTYSVHRADNGRLYVYNAIQKASKYLKRQPSEPFRDIDFQIHVEASGPVALSATRPELGSIDLFKMFKPAQPIPSTTRQDCN